MLLCAERNSAVGTYRSQGSCKRSKGENIQERLKEEILELYNDCDQNVLVCEIKKFGHKYLEVTEVMQRVKAFYKGQRR
jgi:hypothetical protein